VIIEGDYREVEETRIELPAHDTPREPR